jgi:hypothetical protein
MQIVGGGSERVGHGFHQIAPAVSVEIHCQPLVCGWNELRLSESAGPGAIEIIEPKVAAIDELQRRKQLAAIEFHPAPGLTDLHCECMREEVLAQIFAEVRLHAPDCSDDEAIDPKPLLGGAQDAVVPRHHRLPVLDPLFVDEVAEIVPDGRLEFGLPLRKAQDLLVGSGTVERMRGDGGADTGLDRRALQVGDARREVRRRRSGKDERCKSERDDEAHGSGSFALKIRLPNIGSHD